MDLNELKSRMKSKAEERSNSGDYNEFWTPENVGDDIMAMIDEVRNNPWDDESVLYDIEELETGDKYTLRPQKAIMSALEAQHAEKGKVVYLCYTGQTKSKKSGMLYNTYDIVLMNEDELEDLKNSSDPTGDGVKEKVTKNRKKADKKEDAPAAEESPKIDDLGTLVKQVVDFYDGSVEITDVQEYLNKTGHGTVSEEDITGAAVLEGELTVKDGVVSKEA